MVDSLNQNQQWRIYQNFKRFQDGIVQKPPDDKTRLDLIDNARASLQKLISQGFAKSLDLQAAMEDYLCIREHEEALHLLATPVPNVLVPYFQNISDADLKYVVKLLACFPLSSAPAAPFVQPEQVLTTEMQPLLPVPLSIPVPQKGDIAPKGVSDMAENNASTGFSILGKDIDTGERVTIEQGKRLGGTYIIGKTGSGKTTLLVNMIVQDIEQGMGLCFFDTHGDAITDILARIRPDREKDVILLNLLDTVYPFGLNLYQCANPSDSRQVSLTVNYLRDVFAKLFTKGGDLSQTPRIAQTLRTTTLTMIANPGMTLAEFPLLLEDEYARARLIQNIKNPIVELFWKRYERMRPSERQELYGSTLTRVEEFLTDEITLHIFGQAKTTINFREVMDSKPGKILLVKLSRIHSQLTNLVGSVIISQIANAAFSREDTPVDARVQFNIYADEYERFQTPTFAELLTEVRKYKIATCVAHQARGQLDSENKVATLNAATLVVFAVSGEDAEELAKQFDCTPPPAETREEPSFTINRDPVGWVRQGHGHRNNLVNRFVHKYIQPIFDAEKTFLPQAFVHYLSQVNNFLVHNHATFSGMTR